LQNKIMSYTVEQVNQANKECELLGARGGGFVNPNYGGNTNCSETNKPMSEKKYQNKAIKKALISSGIIWLTIVGLGVLLNQTLVKKLKK